MEHLINVGHGLDRGLGRQRLAQSTRAGEEHRTIGLVEGGPVVACVEPVGDRLAPWRIALAAGTDQGAGCGAQAFLVDRRHPLATQTLQQLPAHPREAFFIAEARQQPGALAHQRRHQLGVLADRDLTRDQRQRFVQLRRRVRPGQRFDLVVLCLAQEVRSVGFVHHLETRCDAGFEREALQ